MGMKIYGILASENVDSSGEILKIAGLDTSKLKAIIDEHPPENQDSDFFHTIGAFTFHKKIMSEKDCDTPLQTKCWNAAKAPLLYVEGELADDQDHPDAKSAAALIRFCSKPEIPLAIGFSVDGGIIERLDQNGNPTEDKATGKILNKAMAISGAMTTKPCNQKCFLAPMNDLQKSVWIGEPPARYFDALRKSQAKSSIIQQPYFQIYLKMDKMKKSLADYVGGFTSMSCKKCGSGVRFFKNASSEIPNGCSKCGSHFSLTDLWSSINK